MTIFELSRVAVSALFVRAVACMNFNDTVDSLCFGVRFRYLLEATVCGCLLREYHYIESRMPGRLMLAGTDVKQERRKAV